MNITLIDSKTKEKIFMFGVPYTPEAGDRIICDSGVFYVSGRTWNDTIREVVLTGEKIGETPISDYDPTMDEELITALKDKNILTAVKIYKKRAGVGLKEAKEYVDTVKYLY